MPGCVFDLILFFPDFVFPPKKIFIGKGVMRSPAKAKSKKGD